MMKTETKKIFKRQRKTFADKSDGLLNFNDMKYAKYKLLYACMWLFMLIISLICIIPVIWVALSSFKEPAEMYAVPPTLFPSSISFDKVVEVWNKVDVGLYFKNSVIIIVGCVLVDIVVNGLAGYVLSRVRPIGSAFLNTIIFWSMMLPGISMVPLYMTFVDMPLIHVNLVGSYIPLWLMAGADAFSIFLFRNFFNGISMSYIEAARLDGCTEIDIFRRIMLPLSKPVVVVTAINRVIGTWASFMWPYLLLGNTNKQPIAVLLYKLKESSNVNLLDNEYMMVLMLSIIPMIIVYALLSKHIKGGVNMSGVKG